MANVYIKPEDFPNKMTGKELRKHFKKVTGKTDSEIKKVFKGTKFEKQVIGGDSWKHMSNPKLRETFNTLKTNTHESDLKKLRQSMRETRAEQKSTKPIIKSSSGGGLLGRLFGGRRTTSNQTTYNLSERRRVGGLPPQAPPPVQPTPPSLNQGPNFPPSKLPPNIARPK